MIKIPTLAGTRRPQEVGALVFRVPVAKQRVGLPLVPASCQSQRKGLTPRTINPHALMTRRMLPVVSHDSGLTLFLLRAA